MHFHTYRFIVTIDGEQLSALTAHIEDRGPNRVVTISCALRRDANGFPEPRLSIYEAGEHSVVVSALAIDQLAMSMQELHAAQPSKRVEWRCSMARAESYSPCSFDTRSDSPVCERIVFVGKRG